MNISRRELLKLAASGTAAVAAGAPTFRALAAGKKIPIGLQLYSVRKQCAEDLPGVLEAVAKMGYKGVEFAGYHGRTARELRKMLDDNGLKCCGTHTAMATLLGDALKETIEFNRTLGNPYLIVPWLSDEFTGSVEAVKKTAGTLTEIAAKAKPAGMQVGYHAHAGDFKKLGDTTSWQLLFANAGPDVIMQMDIGNCIAGGGNPLAILEEFPGRSVTIHLKEHGGKPGAVIGEGDVDWQRVFKICETTGGTKWYIVEQEAYADSPLRAVEQCLENLRKMGK